MPQLNEAKLNRMVEAVMNQIIINCSCDGGYINIDKDSIRTALTPECMELTDDEIKEEVEKLYPSDTHTKYIQGAVGLGAKFYRDR